MEKGFYFTERIGNMGNHKAIIIAANKREAISLAAAHSWTSDYRLRLATDNQISNRWIPRVRRPQ